MFGWLKTTGGTRSHVRGFSKTLPHSWTPNRCCEGLLSATSRSEVWCDERGRRGPAFHRVRAARTNLILGNLTRQKTLAASAIRTGMVCQRTEAPSRREGSHAGSFRKSGPNGSRRSQAIRISGISHSSIVSDFRRTQFRNCQRAQNNVVARLSGKPEPRPV